MKNKFFFDKYGCVKACFASASSTRAALLRGHIVALPLDLGNGMMFLTTFIPLSQAIPENSAYYDGSNLGVQINIHGVSSYSLPWDSKIAETGYIIEKWRIPQPDAERLLPFINSVLTGKNYFK